MDPTTAHLLTQYPWQIRLLPVWSAPLQHQSSCLPPAGVVLAGAGGATALGAWAAGVGGAAVRVVTATAVARDSAAAKVMDAAVVTERR